MPDPIARPRHALRARLQRRHAVERDLAALFNRPVAVAVGLDPIEDDDGDVAWRPWWVVTFDGAARRFGRLAAARWRERPSAADTAAVLAERLDDVRAWAQTHRAGVLRTLAADAKPRGRNG